jgi:hypothetical protein
MLTLTIKMRSVAIFLPPQRFLLSVPLLTRMRYLYEELTFRAEICLRLRHAATFGGF